MRKTEKRPKMFCLDPLEGGGRRGQANALLVWVVWAVPCFLSPAWTVTSNISVHHLLSMPTRALPSSWSPPGLQNEEVLAPRAVELCGLSAGTPHCCLERSHSSALRAGTASVPLANKSIPWSDPGAQLCRGCCQEEQHPWALWVLPPSTPKPSTAQPAAPAGVFECTRTGSSHQDRFLSCHDGSATRTRLP